MKRKILAMSLVFGVIFLLNMTNNQEANIDALVASDSIEVFCDEDFITLGFPGAGTEADPYLIENYEIYSTDVNNEGIYVKNTTKYFIIQNCDLTHSFYGILIEDVEPGTGKLLNNYFHDTKHDGLAIKEQDGIIISGNVIETSIYATGAVLENSTNLVVIDNIIQDNPKSGIAVYDCVDLNITGNIFRRNGYKGITLAATTNSVIYENIFEDNVEYGVEFILNSANNLVYHNNFINNFQGGISQGRDATGDSTWYNPTLLEGSYWSDYTGSGTYSIEGKVGCCDLYPLTEPLNFEESPEPEPTETSETSFSYLYFALLLLPIAYVIRRKRE